VEPDLTTLEQLFTTGADNNTSLSSTQLTTDQLTSSDNGGQMTVARKTDEVHYLLYIITVDDCHGPTLSHPTLSAAILTADQTADSRRKIGN